MPLFRFFSMIALTTLLLFSRNTVALNVNTEDFELYGAMDINSFSEYTNTTVIIVDSNYLNTKDQDLFGIGISAHNSLLEAEDLSLGLGVKLIYLEDFVALPMMAEATYAFALSESLPIASLSAAILYAPTALSFSDGEGYFEFRTEVGVEVINSVSIYGGYRDIETEFIGSDFETLNSSFYGGLKMSF